MKTSDKNEIKKTDMVAWFKRAKNDDIKIGILMKAAQICKNMTVMTDKLPLLEVFKNRKDKPAGMTDEQFQWSEISQEEIRCRI